MITNNKETLSVGGGSYESPEVKVLGLETEGVLCASGDIEEWETNSLDW